MSEVFVPKACEITLRGQTVIVRDPALKKVLELLRDAKPMLIRLTSLGSLGDSENAISGLADLLADEAVFKSFCLCASACTDKSVEFFSEDGGISLSEAAQLLDAMRTAVNWEVLKELFRKMLPTVATPPTTPLT